MMVIINAWHRSLGIMMVILFIIIYIFTHNMLNWCLKYTRERINDRVRSVGDEDEAAS